MSAKKEVTPMEIAVIALLSLLALYYLYGTYVSARAMLNKHLIKSLRLACLMRVISFLFVLTGVGMFGVVHLSDEVLTYSYKNGVIYEDSSYGKIDSTLFVLFLTAVLLILASIPLDSVGHDRRKHRMKNASVSLIMSAAVISLGITVILTNYQSKLSDKYDPKFYRYDSPDKSRSIVICERSYGSQGYGDVFQVKDQKAEKIGEFTTLGGFRSGGKYRLGWEKTQITVIYSSGDSIGSTKKLSAKFADI